MRLNTILAGIVAAVLVVVIIVVVKRVVSSQTPVEQDVTSTNSAIVNSSSSANELQMTDLKSGEGMVAEAGKQITVHYVGTFPNGKEFDSSRKANQPFKFRLGAGNVIRGWDEGIVGMKVGGIRKLVIPPQLGYGERGAGATIPPNSTLIFEVELLEVN